MNDKGMHIKELTEKMAGKVEIFTGNNNFDSVHQFINGWICNDRFNNTQNDDDIRFFNDFHDFVRYKIQQEKNCIFDQELSWFSYIKRAYDNDTERINVFFEFAKEFFEIR